MKTVPCLLVGLLLSPVAHAQEANDGLVLPHQFEANTVISADEMNAQFQAVVDKLNELETQNTALAEAVENLSARAQEAEADLANFQQTVNIETRETIVVTRDPGEGEFARLDLALASLDERWIPPGRIVTIEIERETYRHDGEIVLSHPQGDQIRIDGRGSELEFADSRGLVVMSNWGEIDDLVLVGARRQEEVYAPYDGVYVSNGAKVVLTDDVVVRGFEGHGLLAEQQAVVIAEGVSVESSYSGIWARNAVVYADQAILADNYRHGLFAENAATVYAGDVSISGSLMAAEASFMSSVLLGDSEIVTAGGDLALSSTNNSYISARNISLSHSGGRSAARAALEGSMDLSNAVIAIEGNRDFGLHAGPAATLFANGTTVSAENICASADHHSAIYWAEGTPQVCGQATRLSGNGEVTGP